MFKNINSSQKKTVNEKPDLTEVKSKSCCRSTTVRSLWYILSFTLLSMVTTLVLFSLFTVHWKKTASALITENKIFFTEGLFLLCRQAKTSWLPQKDVYCSSANDEFNRWLIAVQFFYTLGSFLNVLTFIAAFIGLFKDVKTKKQAFSSFLFWTLSTACLCQLIAISIYGRYSIGDYTYYEPDYSIIIASVALGINALCVLLFFVDICKSRTTKRY